MIIEGVSSDQMLEYDRYLSNTLRPLLRRRTNSFSQFDEEHILKLLIGAKAPSSLTWSDISMKYMNQIDKDDECLYKNIHTMGIHVIKDNLLTFGHEFIEAKHIDDIGSGNGIVSGGQLKAIDDYLSSVGYEGEKKTVTLIEPTLYQLKESEKHLKNYHYNHLNIDFFHGYYEDLPPREGKKVIVVSNIIQNLSKKEVGDFNASISSSMSEDDALLQIYFENNPENRNHTLFSILQENKHRAEEILVNIPGNGDISKEAKKKHGITIEFNGSVIDVYSGRTGKKLKSISRSSSESYKFGKRRRDRFERNLYGDEKSLYERAQNTVSEYYSIDKDLVRPGIVPTTNGWRIDIWPQDFSKLGFKDVRGPFPLYLEEHRRPTFSSRFKEKVLHVPLDNGDTITAPFERPFNFLESTRRDKKTIDSIYQSVDQKILRKINQGAVTLNYSKKGRFEKEYMVKNNGNPIADTITLPYFKNNDPFEKNTGRLPALKELLIEDIGGEILRTLGLHK